MNHLIKINIYIILLSLLSFGLFSCSDDKEDFKAYVYNEQVGKKIKEVTDLKADAVYGNREGMYPESSKTILDNIENELKDFLQKITEKAISEQEIPIETENILKKADEAMTSFKGTVLTEDRLLPAELHVNGKNGGYIDFGAHPEYSNFSQQAFTVDMWFKFEEIGNFDYLLSTFIDNDDDSDRYRMGWCVNYYGEGGSANLRMTYSLGKSDLYEPWVRFEDKQKWVHVAFVWNHDKLDDGSGNPKSFKMYLDGELVKEEDWHNTYTPNNQNTPMIGFNYTKFNGSVATDGKGTNGYMKHFHIWNSVKSQDEINDIKDNPKSVKGDEADLVCGWDFDMTVVDDANIPDLTGKYSARLAGDYKWITDED